VTVGIAANSELTLPPRRSGMTEPLPLYGTWTMSTCAIDLKSSPAM